MAQKSFKLNPQTKESEILSTCVVVWLDSRLENPNDDCRRTLEQLRGVSDEVLLFTDPDIFQSVLRSMPEREVLLIVPCCLVQDLVTEIHEENQMNNIYVFDTTQAPFEEWNKKWPEIRGIYSDSNALCYAIERAIKHCKQNALSVNLFELDEDFSNEDLHKPNILIMFLRLIGMALLDVEYDEGAREKLAAYCRKESGDMYREPNAIDEFVRDYQSDKSIWWYTKNSEICDLVNLVLGFYHMALAVYLAFFINDLHQQIKQLHQEQAAQYLGQPLTVYRGQGIGDYKFDELKKSVKGLICFDSFFSASKDRNIALSFAQESCDSMDTIGVVFVITIDTTLTSTPFAAIEHVSYRKTEGEVLFSMGSMFRIELLKSLNDSDRLFEVHLTLTIEDDSKLCESARRLQDEMPYSSGWKRLEKLLMDLDLDSRAEQLLITLLEHTSDLNEQGTYYHQLGCIYDQRDENDKAISSYERAMRAFEEANPENRPALAVSYRKIAALYRKLREHSKSLLFYEKLLDFEQGRLSATHPDLVPIYKSIGLAHIALEDFSNALAFFEKAASIVENVLPLDTVDLIVIYDNIAKVHKNMQEYMKRIAFLEKSIGLREAVPKPDRPGLAAAYNEIGKAYAKVGEHEKAMSILLSALAIHEKILDDDDPDLATTCNNIGRVHQYMQEYIRALTFHHRALNIQQKTHKDDNFMLKATYNHIALAYGKMKDYPMAIEFHEKAVAIHEKYFPYVTSDLADMYYNLGVNYHGAGDQTKAFEFLEKALAYQEERLPEYHRQLAFSYSSMGSVRKSTRDYAEALDFFQRALAMFEQCFPPTHEHIQGVLENIESVKTHL